MYNISVGKQRHEIMWLLERQWYWGGVGSTNWKTRTISWVILWVLL